MTEQLIVILFITVGVLITPLVFIGLDFWAGVRKAKKRGERITSDGWKRTLYKISKYYNMLIPLMIIDGMQITGFWYLNTYSNWGESGDHDTDFLIAPKELDAYIGGQAYASEDPCIVLDCSEVQQLPLFNITER